MRKSLSKWIIFFGYSLLIMTALLIVSASFKVIIDIVNLIMDTVKRDTNYFSQMLSEKLPSAFLKIFLFELFFLLILGFKIIILLFIGSLVQRDFKRIITILIAVYIPLTLSISLSMSLSESQFNFVVSLVSFYAILQSFSSAFVSGPNQKDDHGDDKKHEVKDRKYRYIAKRLRKPRRLRKNR